MLEYPTKISRQLIILLLFLAAAARRAPAHPCQVAFLREPRGEFRDADVNEIMNKTSLLECCPTRRSRSQLAAAPCPHHSQRHVSPLRTIRAKSSRRA